MTPDDGNVTPDAAMVEKGARYLRDQAAYIEWYTDSRTRHTVTREDATAVLAAALDPDDTALVEGLARAMVDAAGYDWFDLLNGEHDHYCLLARVALTYLRQQAQT